MDELNGYIEAIVYTQPENGFTVARLKEPRKKDLTVIVGTSPSFSREKPSSAKGRGKSTPPTEGSSR